MLKIIKDNLLFLAPYFLVLVFCLITVSSGTKEDIHIFLNQYYSSFFDIFFLNITKLGEGYIVPVIVIILLFVRYRYLITSILTSLLTAITAQFLKRIIFNNPRPKKYFEEIYTGEYQLRFVPDSEVWSQFSLPSGHTAIAFSTFLLLSIIINKKYWYLKFACFIIASLVGYSRIYLSQHFLSDVILGSLIGTIITITVYYLISKINWKFLDKSLINKELKHQV